MQKRFLPAFFLLFIIVTIVSYSCTKIDTTTLGGDIVTVDNINVFADTLDVITSQGIFNDSSIISKADNHVIGNISNDPLFGKTTAAVYVQFKPIFYPFYFGNAGDTVKSTISSKAGFDSAFICLSYKGAWGDSVTSIPQKFEVRRIVDANFKEKTDTLRPINYQPTIDNSMLLGSADITPVIAKSQFKSINRKDSFNFQIRIKLTGQGATYAANIFNNQDSTAAGPNNALYNDSIFRERFNGFEIKSVSSTGNTLFYVNIVDAKSRLEFHYRKLKNNIVDTVIQSFQMYISPTANAKISSSANYIKRDYTGTNVANPMADDLFLQTTPGTFANVTIPGLTNYPKRIINRAYLIIEQKPNNTISDGIYTPPPFLYLDLKDTLISTPQRYKPVYFDLSGGIFYNPDATNATTTAYHPYPSSNVDINNFGGRALRRYELNGTEFARYEINLTRYVQHISTSGYKNYDLRLYSPFNYYYPQYLGTQYVIPYYNPIALGAVRVGAGSTLPAPHKMRMVVIYTKL